jgi:hypothetical protein
MNKESRRDAAFLFLELLDVVSGGGRRFTVDIYK